MTINYRSGQEIWHLAKANLICRNSIPLIEVGSTPSDIDLYIERKIRRFGATSSFKDVEGYDHASCISVNNVGTHGIPTDTPLVHGDVVSIDLGAVYRGYHGDFTSTVIVRDGARPLTRDTEVVGVALGALRAGIKGLVGAEDVRSVGDAIEEYLFEVNSIHPSVGATPRFAVDEGFTGHGIGQSMHEAPDVPHHRHSPDLRFGEVKPGLVVAIEPLINDGNLKYSEADESGWNDAYPEGVLSAKYEVAVAVLSDGLAILPYADTDLLTVAEKFGLRPSSLSQIFHLNQN